MLRTLWFAVVVLAVLAVCVGCPQKPAEPAPSPSSEVITPKPPITENPAPPPGETPAPSPEGPITQSAPPAGMPTPPSGGPPTSMSKLSGKPSQAEAEGTLKNMTPPGWKVVIEKHSADYQTFVGRLVGPDGKNTRLFDCKWDASRGLYTIRPLKG